MPTADLSKTSIYYEVTGPADGAPLVLIHGFTAQMIQWHPQLCAYLADAGFAVVRFDNRDVGLSSKFDGQEPYTLEDMAADVAELIDHLGRGPVHVVGQSMGGMIAQRLVLAHPDRVASLVLLYTTPDPRFIAEDDPDFRAVRDRPPAITREEAIDQFVEQERLSGANGFDLRELGAQTYDRCYCPEGRDRQWAAIEASGSIVDDLRWVDQPAAVIHGRADRLISSEAGIAIAHAMPRAELQLYDGVGHEIPPMLWDDVVRTIVRTAGRAGLPPAAAYEQLHIDVSTS